MRIITRVSLLTATLVFASTAAAQDTTTVCRASACAIEFDWGGGKTAESIVHDRRYGSGTDFEAGVRSRLTEKGFRVQTDAGGAGLKIALRLSMTAALCEFTAGTNPDRRCRTMRDVNVTFTPIDTTMKRFGTQRITNRCGDPNQLMTMTQFGQHVADVVHYAIEGEAAKARKPVGKC